ncbi:MAG: phosphatidylserine decarboxylase [Rhodospirillales bacterium]|nr:phosphatidylserine decarboxylase [Alphaproteobacteria bacterium]USO04075.1 MAG: phosphatidylserine decarboxylase [Rhodospirillales bacterium]
MSTNTTENNKTLLSTIKETVLVPIHPAGYPFILGGAVITFVCFLIWELLGVLALILTFFCVYFFRDPVRITPQRKGLVISPADGRVCAITEGLPLPPELGGKKEDTDYTRISIFLSVFDVHVNRVPIDGKIIKTAYNPGKFLNAELDKASQYNERASALLELEDGRQVGFVQIAGLVARRIVTSLTEGDEVEAGERYGLIRFGSRADIYLPEDVAPLVCVGQYAIGGETVLADMDGTEPPREGKAQ